MSSTDAAAKDSPKGVTSMPADQPKPPAPARDLRRFTRRAAALAIVTGPVMVTIIRAVMPYWTDDAPETGIAKIAAAPGAITLVNWLSVLSYPFLLLGALAIGYAVRRRVPLLGLISSGVLFTGLSLASLVGASDVLAEVMTRSGYDQTLTVEVTTAYMEHPAGLFGLLAFVLGHLVGMVLIGVTVVRARLVAWWVGAGLIVAQPIHLIASVIMPSRALDVVLGWGLTAVCFGAIAVAVLRLSNDEWDQPPLVGQGVAVR